MKKEKKEKLEKKENKEKKENRPEKEKKGNKDKKDKKIKKEKKKNKDKKFDAEKLYDAEKQYEAEEQYESEKQYEEEKYDSEKLYTEVKKNNTADKKKDTADKKKDSADKKKDTVKKDDTAKKNSSVRAKRTVEITDSDEKVLVLFQTLGDASRLEILRLLRENGEMCGTDLLEKVSVVQSTLSHHMKTLTEAGIVTERKNGRKTIYQINGAVLQQAGAYLERMAQSGRTSQTGRKSTERTES